MRRAAVGGASGSTTMRAGIAAWTRATTLACAATLACAPPPPAPPRVPSLRSDGARLVDDLGREVILRGMNARIAGLFDVTFDDGRTALEEIPAFAAADLAFLRDELGMNALRVPINWSGLQPSPGPIDPGYLDELDRVLGLCVDAAVWCLVDVHQDAYSKEIGEDGAPLWAIVPAPDALLEGPLDDLGARRASEQVLRAFATFFGDEAGVQDAFIDMLGELAVHLRGRAFVAGLEVFNEPVGDSLEVLQFARRAALAVHAVDPDRLVVFEPTSLRNLLDDTDTGGGLGLPMTAYAPHLYPEVFSGQGGDFQSGDPALLVASTARARAEADEHGAPLVVTEYGIGPTAPNAPLWITTMEDEMDRARASRFFWLYEERSQGGWGLYDGDGALRGDLADLLARPYPAAVDGVVASFVVDDEALVVRFTGGGTHTLAVPSRWSAAPRFACDGVAVEPVVDAASPGLSIRCGDGAGDHELTVSR